MKDLIERLEKATGPDRLLDALIAGYHNDWSVIEIGKDDRTHFIRWARRDGSEFMTREGSSGEYTAMRYTASMDLAAALIPDGLYWMAGYGKTREDEPLGGVAIFRPGNEDDPVAKAEAPTVPLALCLAALRAADQQGQDVSK